MCPLQPDVDEFDAPPAEPLWRRSARLAGRALDAVLPHRCAACGVEVVAPGLCPDCFAGLTPLAGSVCDQCGLPFELPQPPDSLCGACLADPPVFAHARAAFRYDEASRPLILGLKHGDRTDLAPVLARHLVRIARPLLREQMVVVAVPLHWRRLLKRRFNQSVLLGRVLAQQLDLPFLPAALVRKRATRSQGGLSRTGRHRNIAGAFKVRTGVRLTGRPVLLVDDVLTSGATAQACSRALLRAGALSVSIVTVARVVRPLDPGL